MSTTNPIESFFDKLAANWDINANDNLKVVGEYLKRAGIAKGQKVLDLACGTGVITGLLHSLTEEDVLGLDLSGEMIAHAKTKYAGMPGIEFMQGDFLSFEGGRYDAIVLYNAYPHFLDPVALSACFARHLSEDGFFIILHSFGRGRLKRHHDGLGPTISRDLEAPEEEAKSFAKEFDICLAEEDENHYLLCGKLKSK